VQQVFGIEVEEADGERKNEPNAGAAAARLGVSQDVSRLEGVITLPEIS